MFPRPAHTFLLLLIFSQLQSKYSFGQGQASHWYFANNCALKFDQTGVHVLTDGNIPETEGTASISDAEGNLLFYANPVAIWNRQHKVMPNGRYLQGGTSCTQGVLILPQPGSGSRFYVFTLDEFQNYFRHGMRYSIVDMCLNGGLGDVPEQTKNIHLLDTCGEKMAATLHADGRDYWILVHSYYSNAFHAFRLTASGITDHITSYTGKVHGDRSQMEYIHSMGQMKISPDGKRIALVNRGQDQGYAEVFDFDNTTGRVSLPRNAKIGPESYGVAFSPDNTKLYITDKDRLTQFDISDIDQAGFSLDQNRTTISTGQTGSGMQLGPDGKVYVNMISGKYIGCIAKPNAAGTNCSFNPTTVFLDGWVQWMTFPSFVDNFKYKNGRTCCRCLNGIEVGCTGDSAVFSLTDSLLTIKSISWIIRDMYGKVLYSGNRPHPRLKFLQPDSVTAEATVHLPDTSLKYMARLLAPAAPQFDFPFDTLHIPCMADKIPLSGPEGNYLYQWDLSGFSSYPTKEVLVTPNMKYVRLHVSNPEGCSVTKTMHLKVIDSVELLSQHQICMGELSVLLRPWANTLHYQWQDGSTGREFTVTKPGKYWVKAYNSENCAFSDTVWVWPAPVTTDILPPNQTLCPGKYLPIDAGQWQEIVWHDGRHERYRTFNKTEKIWVKVNTPCGEITDTCRLSYYPPLPPVRKTDTSLCEGSRLTLHAGPGAKYYTNGRAVDSIELREAGTYYLQLSTQCQSRTDSIQVRYLPAMKKIFGRTDTTLCQGQVWQIDLLEKDMSYRWQDGSKKHTRRISSAGLYTVQAWNSCGTFTDSVRVRMDSCPCDVFIPNAFTPNDDGINQVFLPRICSTQEYQFTIYNPWGERIFETNDPAQGWNGQFKNDPSPIGVYLYRIVARDFINRKIFFSGWVNLVR